MDSHDKFMQSAIDAGKNFLINKPRSVVLLGHFDTDGLASIVIMGEALKKEGIEVTKLIRQHVDDAVIDELRSYDDSTFILVDIGANKEKELSEIGKQIIILDHHNPQYEPNHQLSDNVVHINPHLVGLTERNVISGAGVVYYFCLGMSSSNKEFAHLAILGALGDTQEKNGFEQLNNNILKHAIVQKTIFVGKRLKLFGINSRPLTKVLEYSTDLSIPGVTNNEKGVRDLLNDLNIRTDWNGRPRKFFNLREDEKERLTEQILELKKDEPIENVIVPSYTLLKERKRSFQDMKEYATIINACGRLGEYEIGMKCMLGDIDAQEKAIMNLRVYKNAIRHAFTFIDEHKENPNEDYIVGSDYVIVNLHDKIKSSLVGIVASILARNKHYEPGTIICTLAKDDYKTIKVSMRVSGDSPDKNVQAILQAVCEQLGVSSGGHKNAAGVVINSEDEKKFLDLLASELKK